MVEYGYNAVENRTSTYDSIWQDRSQVYKYDRRHRLKEFRRGEISGDPGSYAIEDNDLLADTLLPGKQAWDLDSRGNWESLVTLLNGVSGEQTRTHNGANEIEQIDPDGGGQLTAVDYGVDHNGNLLADPLAPNAGIPTSVGSGQRYEYDAANRLTKVWRTNDPPNPNDDEPLLEIAYDALGRRIQSTEHIDPAAAGTPPVLSQPKITVHVYAGFEPIEEYDADTNGPGAPTVTLAREFVWGMAFPEPVAMIDHTDSGDTSAGMAEVLHYLHDALGSVIGLTDASGTLVERYDYDPYGKTYVQDVNSDPRPVSHYGNPWMWTGQRFDATTHQYHFTFRGYSPTTGRWLQRDPLGYWDGLNSYEYVNSEPLGWFDLLGLDASARWEAVYDRRAEDWVRNNASAGQIEREVQRDSTPGIVAAAISLASVAAVKAGIATYIWVGTHPEVVPVAGTIASEVMMGDASPNQAVVGSLVDDAGRGLRNAADEIADAAGSLADDAARTLTNFAPHEEAMVNDVLKQLEAEGVDLSLLKELIKSDDMPAGAFGFSLPDGMVLGDDAFKNADELTKTIKHELEHIKQHADGLTKEGFGPGTAEGLEEAARAAEGCN